RGFWIGEKIQARPAARWIAVVANEIRACDARVNSSVEARVRQRDRAREVERPGQIGQPDFSLQVFDVSAAEAVTALHHSQRQPTVGSENRRGEPTAD